jgi:hypothetical protein
MACGTEVRPGTGSGIEGATGGVACAEIWNNIALAAMAGTSSRLKNMRKDSWVRVLNDWPPSVPTTVGCAAPYQDIPQKTLQLR